MKQHYPDPPEHLWLEQWPDESDRDDYIHYGPTGYGIGSDGFTSRVTVYRRLTDAEVEALIKGGA